MVKRTITFIDYNGKERTEDHYFNYTEAELSELEWSKNGGFSEYVKRIVQAQDMEQISSVFKRVVLESYGIKSLDGRRFQKGENHEFAKEFMETPAYNKLFMDLMTTKGALAAFFNELVPQSVVEKAEEARKRLEAEEEDRKKNAIQ